ncbi:hypothetical protein MKW98_032738 [Papaver atlanticum]|uniref:Ultraviolet-B-repressible protein n=1 Tax=Papaver atlanticum TaxID=357466 RepID=A0AAD4RZ58_9MAGN|nr:hypothetical protein MKW98_032738 [Papaver atlanticum]
MASTSMAVQMAMPITSASQKKTPATRTFFNPLPLKSSKSIVVAQKTSSVRVQASLKEKAIAGLTAATLTATMVIPEVAEAAGSDLSPSLQNFLYSIIAGGTVLTAILGAVIGVSNFDPVKRA